MISASQLCCIYSVDKSPDSEMMGLYRDLNPTGGSILRETVK